MERLVLHTFAMGDVEDPDLYVSPAIYEWQQTPKGKWAMKHGNELKYHIYPDDHSMGYKVKVTGLFEDKHLTYFRLINS